MCQEKKPEFIIGFIYNNIYELIKNMKYINDSYYSIKEEDFYTKYELAYKNYYKRIILTSNDPFLLYIFPNPNYKERINFKNLYIGVVGRLDYNSTYWYGDPVAWNLSYFIKIEEGNRSSK